MKSLKDKRKDILINLLIILFANTLCAIAINVFFIPNKLLSGGIGGISIMVQYLLDIPTGITVFVINLPIFIYGFKKVDKHFALYGSISMVVFSIVLTLTSGFGKYTPSHDILIGAIVGGVLNGIGVGLLFKNRMCQDGLDVLATILRRKHGISLGNTLLGVNSLIVILSSLLFDFTLAIYTIIAIFMSSKLLDKVRVGFNVKKSVFIISDEGEALAEEIRNKLNRSVTFLQGMGSYKKLEKLVIYIVINSNEVVQLKNIVESVDKNAFTAINDVVEARGSTFSNDDI